MTHPTAAPALARDERPDVEGALARAEAATEGPWSTGGIFDPDGSRPTQNVWSAPNSGDQSGGLVASRCPTRDATFIAHARSDVPALARYALALEAERSTLLALVATLTAEAKGAGERAEGVVEAAKALSATLPAYEICPQCEKKVALDHDFLAASKALDLALSTLAPGSRS